MEVAHDPEEASPGNSIDADWLLRELLIFSE